MGIFLRSLNDENRPDLDPKLILKYLCETFQINIKDFVVLLLNKITFSKLKCCSANMGDIDFKKKDLKNNNNLIHFSIKTNIEINRLYYLKEKKISEIIDNFYFSIKNLIDNSFYKIKINMGENVQKLLMLKSTEILKNVDEIRENKNFEISVMMPINLMDFELFNGKNSEFSEKILIKFRSKIVSHFYLFNDLSYSELIQIVKNHLINYIGENIENLLTDNYLDMDSPQMFHFDIDNKFTINYNDSIHFIMDQNDCNYNVN
jgi:hypothetical protein